MGEDTFRIRMQIYCLFNTVFYLIVICVGAVESLTFFTSNWQMTFYIALIASMVLWQGQNTNIIICMGNGIIHISNGIT